MKRIFGILTAVAMLVTMVSFGSIVNAEDTRTRITLFEESDPWNYKVAYDAANGDKHINLTHADPTAPNVTHTCANCITEVSGAPAWDSWTGKTQENDGTYVTNATEFPIGSATAGAEIETLSKTVLTYKQNHGIYLRKKFTIGNPTAIGDLKMQVKFDDGIVVYVNGHYVYDRNARGYSSLEFATYPKGNTLDPQDPEAAVQYGTRTFVIPRSVLVNGENEIQAFAYNDKATSSDIFFASSLSYVTSDTAKDMTKFTIKDGETEYDVVFNGTNGTVTVPATVNLTNITPFDIQYSQYASISPAANTPQNFTNPVKYTVTAEDGSTKDYMIAITHPVVDVTGLTINSDKATIVAGKTYQIIAKVSPDNATNKTVLFTTNDANVATVSQTGMVTGKKAGTAFITAKIGDFSKICTVTVTAAPVNIIRPPAKTAIKKVNLKKKSITLKINKTWKLMKNIKSTVPPKAKALAPKYKLTISKKYKKFVKIKGLNVKALKKGKKKTVKISIKNGSKVVATLKIKIK